MTKTFDRDHLDRFLSYILDPAVGCAEVRIPKADWGKGSVIVPSTRYTKTISGWFDNSHEIYVAASRLRGISGFITINPVISDLLSRADNKLIASTVATCDEEIACIRWVFVDIDPIRPKETSANDKELAAAIARRDAILAAHPEFVDSAIWGTSGNGCWLLIRLPDYPNDEEHNELIAKTLEVLSRQFTDGVVKIDTVTKNPSRIMALVGTMKCKGSNRKERPWRLATIDSPVGKEVIPFDLASWIATHDIESEDQGQQQDDSSHRNGHADSNRRASTGHASAVQAAYALSALRDEVDAVARAAVGDRNTQLNKSAFALGQLVAAGWLKQAEVEQSLWVAARSIGLDDREIASTIASGLSRGTKDPRDSSKVGQAEDNPHRHNGRGNPPPNGTRGGPAVGSGLAGPTFEFSDTGNARRLTYLHGHRIRHCAPYGQWLIFDSQRWAKDDRLSIESFAKDIPRQILMEMTPGANDETLKPLRSWYQASQGKDRLMAAVHLARSEPGIPVLPRELDRNPWLLNVQNGTIDMETGEFREHRPGDLITRVAPVLYDPKAKCPTWDKFIREIMGNNADLVDFLQRATGYATTGVIREHAFFFLYGTGRNGKTTFLNTIQHILGDYANEIDSDILISQATGQHPTGLTELEGRRFIVANEVEDGKRLAEALVKKLTGGNPIQARKMHKDFYTFLPSHHIFLAANHKPEIKGADPGIWRRVKLIPFTVSFDLDLPNGRRPDLDLEKKLLAESSGVLNWLIRACGEWREHSLIEPPVIKRVMAEYRQEMDTLGWFVEEKCVQDEDVRAEISELYTHYNMWCDRTGVFPLSIRRFSSQLGDRGFKRFKSNSVTFRLGLRLKAFEESEDERKEAYRAKPEPELESVQEELPF